MPSEINRLPLGLLGFLGIKNGGAYPRELVNVLSPTWDLGDLYMFANAEGASAAQAVNALGASSIIQVPDGEAWYLVGASVSSATLGAGQTLQMGLMAQDPSATITIGLRDPSNVATVGLRALTVLDRPFYAGPGWRIGPSVVQLAAGPVTVNCTVLFARMRL